MRFIDLTGNQFDRLTVLRQAEVATFPSGARKLAWVCRCTCGQEVTVLGVHLRSGRTRSCGCLAREHVGAESPLWKGDDISYVGAHARIYAAKGKASGHECKQCRSAMALDWALVPKAVRKGKTLNDGNREYSTSVDDYKPLCRRCHHRIDNGLRNAARGKRPAINENDWLEVA